MPPKNVIFVVNIILIRELLDELISLQRSLGEIQGVLKGKQDTLFAWFDLISRQKPQFILMKPFGTNYFAMQED